MVAKKPASLPDGGSDQFSPADVVLLVVLGGMWGTTFLLLKILLDVMQPVWIIASRTFIGACVLYVLLRASGGRLPSDRATWFHLLVLGITTNAIPWTAVAWGQQFLPSGLTAMILAAVPVSTLVFAVIVGIERFTAYKIAGFLLALCGVAVILLDDLADTGRTVAILIVVASSFCYAAGTVYAKRNLSGRYPPMAIANGQVMVTAAVTFPVALLLDGWPSFAAFDAGTASALVMLGSVSTGIAFVVFYRLIERVGPTNTVLVSYLIPIVAVIAGALVLGERLGRHALVGGLLVIAGMHLSQRRHRLPPAAARQADPA